MHGPREVLNRLKWADSLESVEVWYVHRGAPNDERMVWATGIKSLGRSFFEIEAAAGRSGSIPYHRVLRIVRGQDIIWSRTRESSP
ncbi:MAG: RNA repair domain-containing protein [Candidatus Thermoplasmatota archaeon]